MLEAADVGMDTLAVLPVLTERVFLSGFPASQNRSRESRWSHWEMARVWQGRVTGGEHQPAGTAFLGVDRTGAPSPF